ncbi:hypothetical protein [Campylobacter fetus]|nr:hypothetical protein [Campylobacter fetus]
MSKTTRLAAGEIRFAPYLNDGTLGEEISLRLQPKSHSKPHRRDQRIAK